MEHTLKRTIQAALIALLVLGLSASLSIMSLPQLANAETLTAAGADDITVTTTEGVTTATPETATAANPKLKVQAKVKGKGWLKAVKAGKLAGTKTSRGLRAFKITLTGKGDLTGSIKYRTYDMGLGWGKTVANGISSGRASKAVCAVKIWLTGDMAEQYDVWYRGYVKGKGWQPWVKNKKKSGITKKGYYLSAISVKIAPKSDSMLDETKTMLDGIDISSWQQGLDPAKVDADFIIVKATEGTYYTNPYFKKWADATLASGKLLGSYHFVRKGDAIKQADFFVKTVGPYIGKCVLFLDWENAYGVDAMAQGPKWAKKFLDRVYQQTGVKPLIYMSKNVTRQYNWKSVANKYGLWVAQYLYKYYNNGSGYIDNPDTDSNGFGAWTAPTIYQYNSKGHISGYSGNLDINKFYGDVAAWQALAAKS